MVALIQQVVVDMGESLLYFLQMIGYVFMSGGWFVFVILVFVILFRIYMDVIQTKFMEAVDWTILSIRVGEDNERTPRSMEEVFNELHGLEKKPDLLEQYLDGYVQLYYSFEIRGTSEGVTFYIRTPSAMRNMVEAAVYAQYPDAEIEEAEDYMDPFPPEKVEKEFDMWGSELALMKPDIYPIRTYVDFEDQFSEDGRLVDPMAAVTEELGAGLQPGEEMWIQILGRPIITNKWQEEGMRAALKMAGREPPQKAGIVERTMQSIGGIVLALLPHSEEQKKEVKEQDLGALKLTPGETDIVRAIQRNVSKFGFQAQYRMAYVAPKDVFQRKGKAQALFGLFRQYSSIDLNQFKPPGRFITSKPTYFMTDARKRWRKRRALARLRGRSFPEAGFILTTEELATIYHFPSMYVKTPTVERTRSRRGEAPTNVPLASAGSLFA